MKVRHHRGLRFGDLGGWKWSLGLLFREKVLRFRRLRRRKRWREGEAVLGGMLRAFWEGLEGRGGRLVEGGRMNGGGLDGEGFVLREERALVVMEGHDGRLVLSHDDG
jgi:hypothetical protein